MSAKQFNTKVTNSEVKDFYDAFSTGEGGEKEFIKKYLDNKIKDNIVLEIEDIYSLLLIRAIVIEDNKVVKHILSKNYQSNILVNIDQNNNSPIYSALFYGVSDILDIIKNYIHLHKIEKVEMPEKGINQMVPLLFHTEFRKTYIQEYITPVYAESSVEKIRGLIGEDEIYDLY